jgi:hypothetical protein
MSGRAWVLVAAVSSVAATAPAQPTLDVSIGGSLQSLATPALGTTDTQSSLAGGAGAGLDFASRRGHLGYGLDAGSYASEGDWSYRLHRFDGRFRLDLSSSTRLHVGASGALRRNGAAWQDADYDAVAGFANLETTPREGLTFRTGYRIDRRVFDAMRSLDQTEQGVFASLLVNLPSGTTLIAEARGGVKGYRGEPVAVVTPDEPATGASGPPSTAAPSGQGAPASGGNGSGANGSGGNGTGAQGARGGAGQAAATTAMGPGTRPVLLPATASPSDHAQQLTLLARVAQSLGERTGLSLQATWRGTGGTVPPAVVTTPAGFFDDGVYDDPYASDHAGAELRLKHVRPGGAVFEAAGRRFVQSYTAALALGPDGAPLPGEPLREDRVWRASATAEVPLFPAKTGALAVGLQLGCAFTRSASNDAFYDYRNHAGAVALTLGY